MGDLLLVFGVVAIIGLVLITRLLGAWMLRIDEVITASKATNGYLKQISRQLNELDESINKLK